MRPGGSDSTIRVWDVQTREVKLVVDAKGPVTALLVQPKPAHMVVHRSGETGAFLEHLLVGMQVVHVASTVLTGILLCRQAGPQHAAALGAAAEVFRPARDSTNVAGAPSAAGRLPALQASHLPCMD